MAKFAKAWTYRSPMRTVSFAKGMDCPDYALEEANEAGVLAEPEAEKPKRGRAK